MAAKRRELVEVTEEFELPEKWITCSTNYLRIITAVLRGLEDEEKEDGGDLFGPLCDSLQEVRQVLSNYKHARVVEKPKMKPKKRGRHTIPDTDEDEDDDDDDQPAKAEPEVAKTGPASKTDRVGKKGAAKSSPKKTDTSKNTGTTKKSAPARALTSAPKKTASGATRSKTSSADSARATRYNARVTGHSRDLRRSPRK